MAALSNYLESGLLHHIFKGETFSAPSVIAIGLSSGVVVNVNGVATPTGTYDAATGGTCGELSTTAADASANGYGRLNLGDLQLLIESKKIKSSDKIDIKYLQSSYLQSKRKAKTSKI